MNVTSDFLDDIEALVPELEQLLMGQEVDTAAIEARLVGLQEEARFFHADTVHDALRELATTISGQEKEAGDTGEAVLPILFRLRDAAEELRENEAPRRHGPGTALEIDLQDEIDEVLTLTPEQQGILNARRTAGHLPYLVVVRTRDDALDAVEEALEAQLPILSYRRQERTARITCLVVDAVEPPVERIVRTELRDEGALRDVLVRRVEPEDLRGTGSLADAWYRTVPPVTVVTDPAILERVRYLSRTISPGDDGRSHHALWREFRKDLDAALSVDLRSMVREMAEALEALAVEAGRSVRIRYSGTRIQIGAEIAEHLRHALFQVFASAIQFGIEPPDTRRAAGKDEVGEIVCSVMDEPPGITVRVHDDGAVVDRDAQQQRAGGGLRSARELLRNTIGGSVRLRSGSRGASVVMTLPAVRGTYRALITRRNGAAIAVPTGLIDWAGTVASDRVAVDTAGSRFLRYNHQMVPLVEPAYRESETRPGPDDDTAGLAGDVPVGTGNVTASGSGNRVPAAVVVRLDGYLVALAVDSTGSEAVVAAGEDGHVIVGEEAAESIVPVRLNDLPLGR